MCLAFLFCAETRQDYVKRAPRGGRGGGVEGGGQASTHRHLFFLVTTEVSSWTTSYRAPRLSSEQRSERGLRYVA